MNDCQAKTLAGCEQEDGFAVRFWARVDQSGGPDACWLWRGGRFGTGYGAVWIASMSRMTTAHRLAVWLDRRQEPQGLEVLRHGDQCVRHCCNPGHLTVGTRLQNARDSIRCGTKPRGSASSCSLRPELLERISLMLLAGHAPRVIAIHTGVSAVTIREIRRGDHWSTRGAA